MQTSKKKHRENKKEKEAQGNVYSKDINIQGQFQMKEKHRDSFKGKVNTGTVSKEREHRKSKTLEILAYICQREDL